MLVIVVGTVCLFSYSYPMLKTSKTIQAAAINY